MLTAQIKGSRSALGRADSNKLTSLYNNSHGKGEYALIGRFCLTLIWGCGIASYAAAPPSKCPVSLNRLDLRYNHSGGQSIPQLKLAFTNHTDKTITGMTFSLSILDSEGNPRPYSENLSYHRDVPPGDQQRSHAWTLDPTSVDMHHTGESMTLLAVQFADDSSWKDGGSQACTLLVDFHAK